MSAARTSEGTGAGRRPSTVSKHPVVGKLGGEPDLLSSSVPDTPPDASSSSTESLLAALATVSSPSDDLPPLLSALHARESALLSRLQSLRATHQSQLLSRDLSRLDALRTSSLTSRLLPAARSLADATVGPAASTAARLGNRVRTLDVEKARVEATLRAVEAVAELKACVLGVVGSMGAPQDWEAAAAYVARAERVEKRVVESEFARRTVPSVEVPDPPATVLEDAKESLCGLFLREFERAAEDVSKAGADQEKAADAGARVTRFFKLFPLIGRGDVGLDVYGRYVCQGVAGTARAVLREGAPATGSGSGTLGGREGYFYAAALTRLFEHVARVVADHGALVERHYGKGRMVRVIGRLQAEVDVQAGIVLDTWSDERGVDRRLTDVRSYPFSFLVQSFLPVQTKTSSVLAGVGVGGIGTPRINSPAVGASTADNARNSEDEGVNMKEVDALLAEIAVMLGRWSLYARFLAGKCRDPETPDDAPLVLPDVLVRSNLCRKVSSKLIEPYNVMTTFYVRRSVEKAFQEDEMPTGLSLSMSKTIQTNAPYIISAVDVVMYIVNAVVQRTLDTSQRDVVAAVVPAVARVLGADFIGMVQRKMRDESYPKPLVQGGYPPEDKIIAFVVLINSLDVANEYLARIINGRLGLTDSSGADQANGAAKTQAQARLRESFPFENDATFVASALSTLLSSFTAKSTELLTEGVQVLFRQVVRLRLVPVLADTWRDADYSLSAEELDEAARRLAEEDTTWDGSSDPAALLQEQVSRRFEHGWDALMRPLQRIMRPATFTALLDATARHLAAVLEKRAWSYAGRATPLGAVRMERDFGAIVATVSRGNYAARELFARTQQVLMIANMEDDEWDELVASGGGDGADEDATGIKWVLSEEEKRKARMLVKG